MKGLLRSFRSGTARALSMSAAALVVAMQLALPALHAEHDAFPAPALHPDAPLLRAAPPGGHEEAKHESLSCEQCRLVSQIRALTPSAGSLHLPVRHGFWIATAATDLASSEAALDQSAPRAPPELG